MKYFEYCTREKLTLNELRELIICSQAKSSWYLLEIEGAGNISDLGMYMSDLMTECVNAKNGKKVELEFVLDLLRRMENLDSLLLLGGKVNFDSIDLTKEQSIYTNSQYVFEYFDSTLWRITSTDKMYIDLIPKILENIS